MGRVRRVDVGGIVYHAWIRASFRAALFQREAHYQDFVGILEESLNFGSRKGFLTPFSLVGPGTVAVANSDPQAYPFGCSVTVYGPDVTLNTPLGDQKPEYQGVIHDTGAGWDRKHHDVGPGQWIDIWKSSCAAANRYGVPFRIVKICCEECAFKNADLPPGALIP